MLLEASKLQSFFCVIKIRGISVQENNKESFSLLTFFVVNSFLAKNRLYNKKLDPIMLFGKRRKKNPRRFRHFLILFLSWKEKHFFFASLFERLYWGLL